jgi:uncharacterized protein YprB with RNaseH-like and TPR domain
MLDKLKLENILFLDIETVPQYESYDQLSEAGQKLWAKKAAFLSKNEELPEELYERAGIYAEFGKIVCISVGIYRSGMSGRKVRITSFANHDEEKLLKEFKSMLEEHFSSPYQALCGHNGKEFDFPYIARRMLINGISLPPPLQIAGKKPWEINHIDTMELWKFGDFKNFTSLELLAHVFDIPTPKNDIDGSMVREVYYEENDLKRIVTYCEKDVVTLMQLMLRYKGEQLLKDEEIDFV